MDLGTTSIGIGSSAQRLLNDLRGVPRPALQTVFGSGLGRRIWRQVRGSVNANTESSTNLKTATRGVEAPISDGEIVAGMIAYASRRAEEALVRNRRQAREIGLRLVYIDGRISASRTRLLRATSDPQQLQEAAMALFRKAETYGVSVAAVNLSVSSRQAESALAKPDGVDCALVATAVAS